MSSSLRISEDVFLLLFWQEELLGVRQEMAGKKEEVCEVQKRLAEQIRCLQEGLQTTREELEEKERELSSLTQTGAEQRHQMEACICTCITAPANTTSYLLLLLDRLCSLTHIRS